VPESTIQLRVLRRGERTDALLRELASRFDRDDLEPDDAGLVVLRFSQRGPQAWDQLREALDALGPDWRERLHLAPRPRR
jgi:hypothetical protein